MINKKLNISNYIIIFLLILANISTQIFILKKTSKIEVLIGLNGIFFVMFLLLFSTKKFHNILIILYFLPLIYLNNAVHYQFQYELFFALPLFLLAFYTFAVSMMRAKREKNIEILSKPILYFATYYILLGIWGIMQGYSKTFILSEGFHFLLFGSIILFRYHLTTRDDYLIIFKALLIIFILISFEYIILGSIISGDRFVTFQSGFLPFVSGILFSLFLFLKGEKNKLLYIVILLIVILGMVSTLTRSLWVTTGITLISVYIFYLWSLNRLTLFKKSAIAVFLVFSMVFVVYTISNTKANEALGDTESVEDRAKSIANPTEDHSFLMRVEMGWYAMQKFYEKPIFGWGLGDFLRYQFLGNSQLRNSYIDNSWFYFLWKGGIIGFFFIALVFYRSINVGLQIVTLTNDIKIKAVVIGLISGLVGIIALSFLSPIVIKYRTNVFFPLIWAYLEFEYNNLKYKSRKTIQ